MAMSFLLEIEIEKIKLNPFQMRKKMKGLEELAQSIIEQGIVQPLVIKEEKDGYELIAGERRLRAAKLIGLKKIPCIVRKIEDKKEQLEIALIENIQRENLNSIEEAGAYQRLIKEFDFTQEMVAQKTGKSREKIANSLRLLNLPFYIQKALEDDKISEGHAKIILQAKGEEQKRGLFEKIIQENLSVRKAEEILKKIFQKNFGKTRDIFLEDLQGKLEEIFQTKVVLEKTKKGGKIIIHFYSDEELERITNGILE